MSELHLLRPLWLLGLPLLPLLLWALHRRRGGHGHWEGVCDPALLPFVVQPGRGGGNRGGLALLGLGGLLILLALAGPSWQRLPQPVFQGTSALVIALDLSRSMDAADLKPSRLTRARYKLLDILKQRREGQTALIVYAGQPFVVSPLTTDTATIANQVQSLSTDMMPSQGSRSDLAAAKARELLQQAGVGRGDLLFITDGPGTVAPAMVQQAAGGGLRIGVLGVGTPEGAPIPREGGGFLKNAQGEVVLARLQGDALAELARLGGGDYVELQAGDEDIRRLLAPLANSDAVQAKLTAEIAAELWEDAGPWLLLPLLPLGLMAFRRGLLWIALIALLPLPRDGYAFDWADLWARPDQQGARLLEQKDPKSAAERFQDPEWQAVARYQASDYEGSLHALQGIDSARAHYNRGNALARLGRLPEAIAAYDEALKRDPSDQDAKYNRDLVEQLRQQQQLQQAPAGGGESENPPQQETPEQGEAPQPQEGDGGQQGERPEGAEQGREQPAPQKQPSSRQGDAGTDPPSPAEPPPAATSSEGQAAPPEPHGGMGSDEKSAGEETPEPEAGQTKETPAEPPADEPPAQPLATEGEAAEGGEEGDRGAPATAASPAQETPTQTPEQAAVEQWLRRIPDDPGGLLRRKFLYQYQKRGQQQEEAEPW